MAAQIPHMIIMASAGLICSDAELLCSLYMFLRQADVPHWFYSMVSRCKKKKSPTKRSIHIPGQDVHAHFLFISHLTVNKCTVLILAKYTNMSHMFLFFDGMFAWNKIYLHFFEWMIFFQLFRQLQEFTYVSVLQSEQMVFDALLPP